MFSANRLRLRLRLCLCAYDYANYTHAHIQNLRWIMLINEDNSKLQGVLELSCRKQLPWYSSLVASCSLVWGVSNTMIQVLQCSLTKALSFPWHCDGLVWEAFYVRAYETSKLCDILKLNSVMPFPHSLQLHGNP